MGTHLAAYFQAPAGGALSLAELNVVQDDILTQNTSSRFQVDANYNTIYACAALANTLSRAQIDTPTLQKERQSFEVFPRVTGGAKFTLANPEIDIPLQEVKLTPSETCAFKQSDAYSTAFSHYGLIWFKKPGPLPPMPPGEVRRVRGTGTTTLVKGVWGSVTITPDNALEPGQYTMVGMFAMSTGAVAARLLFTGQGPRPGVPAFAGTETATTDLDIPQLIKMFGYAMGTFTHINLPQVQFLSDSADTAETVYMYVVRTGDAPTGAAV